MLQNRASVHALRLLCVSELGNIAAELHVQVSMRLAWARLPLKAYLSPDVPTKKGGSVGRKTNLMEVTCGGTVES